MFGFGKNKEGVIIEATARIAVHDNVAVLHIAGDWLTSKTRTNINKIARSIDDKISVLKIDTSKLGRFDSALICLLLRCHDLCEEFQIVFDKEGLNKGARVLLDLATAVPEAKTGSGHSAKKKNIIGVMGTRVMKVYHDFKDQVSFIGEVTIAFAKACVFKARYRTSDLMLIVQQSGPDALPIIALMNFLFGLILGFVSITQFAKYGSQIFVADLVALAMVREMGAIMVGIVMAGRTGAAFSAELATMKFNEEISAYRTLGISPIEFLVIPRIIALVAMFPLLTILANVIGIIGGFVVGVGMSNVTTELLYIHRTISALTLTHVGIGIMKSVVFGIIVAMVGCYKGMRSGNSSAAIGQSTTESVVTSIKLIIVADGIFAVIFYIFDI